MQVKLLLPFFLCALSSGCLDAGESNPAVQDSQLDPEGPKGLPPADVTVPFADPQRFALSDCSSIIGSFEWLGDAGPGEAPPGWEQQLGSGGIGSAELVEIMTCDRVSIGPFERPLVLLFEAHSKMDPPATCKPEEGFIWILNSLWTNDAAVSGYLSEELGIRTQVANFEADYQNDTHLSKISWSWAPTGNGTVSQLTVLAAEPEPQASPLTLGFRYAWNHGSGISIMRYNETAIVPTSPEQAAFGSFTEPMLHASTGVEPFVGRGDYFLSVDATTEITRYGDFTCTKESY